MTLAVESAHTNQDLCFKLGERTQVGTPLPLLPNVCLRDRQTGWSGGQQPASESRHGQLGWKSRLWLWQIQWETGRTQHFDVEKQTWQPSYAIDIIDIIMLSSPVLVSFVKRCRRMWAMTSPPRHWQLAPVEDVEVKPPLFCMTMLLNQASSGMAWSWQQTGLVRSTRRIFGAAVFQRGYSGLKPCIFDLGCLGVMDAYGSS